MKRLKHIISKINKKATINFDERIEALADYLGLDITDVEIDVEDGALTEYNTPDGIYHVMNQREADVHLYNYFDESIKDMGIETFREDIQGYLLENYTDTDWFDEWWGEDCQAYAENLNYAELINECLDADIISEDDFDEDDDYIGGLEDYELQDELADYKYQSTTDYKGEFINAFGKEEFYQACKKHASLDIQGIVDYIKEQDDYGYLATYDGVELNLDYGYYGFRID